MAASTFPSSPAPFPPPNPCKDPPPTRKHQMSPQAGFLAWAVTGQQETGMQGRREEGLCCGYMLFFFKPRQECGPSGTVYSISQPP